MFILPFPTAQASIMIHDYDELAKMPILDQGRVKPMDTFARSYLEGFYGKDSLPNVSAMEWLTEVLFEPETSYQRPIFNIPNPKVADALELEHRPQHRYSYTELSTAFTRHFQAWHSLFMKDEKDLTFDQKQLLTIFNKAQVFADLSHSLTLLFAEFQVPDGISAAIMQNSAGTALDYWEVRKYETVLQEKEKEILEKTNNNPELLSADEHELLLFVDQIRELNRDKTSKMFRVIPPQWEGTADWFSPWSIAIAGHGSPKSSQFVVMWKDLANYYRSGDNALWVEQGKKIRGFAAMMAQGRISADLLDLEFFYNRLKPFGKSLFFYLTAFLVLLTSFLYFPAGMKRIAAALIIVGFGFHLGGLIARMIIMHRPPVTNLYESIIFVSLIAIIFGFVVEWREKNGIGLLIAATIGSVLHFIGLKYDTDGDTMGMLTAVLNTNFWLSTHVVTVTIGYGCSLVGGILGQVYLLQRLIQPKNYDRLTALQRNLQGVAIVALFFAITGTILGGIWADQSWGRFWGWDPKENGALLIVLWLIWLTHGKISSQFTELQFACGMALLTVVVSLAWFGVNLLSVGLHSYGFTENAAFNLGLFDGVELVIVLGCYIAIRRQQRGVEL